AVVGACQLIHHDIFKLVGGYDETFQVSYSDIVLCISAVYAGFRTIYVPQAVIAHRDSALCEPSESTSDRALLAKRLREVGFDADPLFHPALDTLNFLQQIKPVDLCGSRGLRAAIECLAGTVDLRQPLDIYDDGAVASAIGYRWDKIIWSFTPTELFLEPVGAAGARIIIFFLRRRPDLRLRFPKALRDGAKGPFANWVRTEGIHLLRLPEEAGIWIDSAFNSNFDAAARHLLLHDSEFLRDTPFLFLPTGRAAVCKRLFTAFTEEAVTLEQIWWFLLVTAEAPLEELCLTWALTPSWQSAVPDGATAIGIFKLVKWVAATHNVTDDWLFEPFTPTNISEVEQLRIAYSSNQAWQDRFPNAFTNLDEARAFVEFLFTRASGLRFQGRNWLTQYDASTLAYELRKPGVNVLGHFAYPSGLRVSTESIVEGLRANDIALSLRNVPTSFTSDDPVWHRFVGIESFDTTIIHVQPRPFFENAYSLSGLRPRSSRTYRIGYWYWELDDVPPDWNRAAFDCDEFWVATEFIANSLSKNYPQPIKVLPPGVEIEPFEPLPRSYFGLKDGDYIFLFVFHMSSIMSRKNPLGLISAFAKAFESGDRARLVIKTSLGMAHPEQTEILRKAAADCGVILLEDTFSRSETLALLNICDAYVSLHRSEGLGLTMAEAMLLGKPTIGTRYSGNLDFMNDDNSLLCDCRIVTLNHDLLPYQRGQLWAEPSVGHAAQLMRSLYLNQGYGRDLGARSRRDLEARFSYKLNGARMAKRLAEIQSTF
ncbi:MAG TPA: glycosyltransferase, partial [Chitinophagaceae bacterium]|nr:glycosyltransferase [Chitinophagaceae bacterium]